jgi:hypothetical protein
VKGGRRRSGLVEVATQSLVQCFVLVFGNRP